MAKTLRTSFRYNYFYPGENQLEDEGLRLLLSKKNDLKCLTFRKFHQNLDDNNCTNLGFSLNVASVIHNPNLI